MNLQPGMQVGDYQILRELGAGGMGKVFQVRNVISDRIEAMKVLLPDLVGDSGLMDRFLREIKVQAALDHPNIAGLRTAMRDGNQLLMIMEFVEGHTVGEYLQQGPLPAEHAASTCMEVLSALDYAHSRGIVHRDIKPSNIMITTQGQVKLMDFGIARVMNDPSLTQAHQTTGSLYYMSPEQINGAQLDGRSDLYSLAISLYEMVTGRRPFDGENTFAIMAAHMQQPPVPPVQLDPRVPPALSNVILRGLGKQPGDRFQNAAEFRAALSQVFQQAQPQPQPQPQQQPEPVYQQSPAYAPANNNVPPPAKSNRTLYMLAGSLATVAVLAVLVTQAPKFLRTRAQQSTPPAQEQQQPPPQQQPQQQATDQPPVSIPEVTTRPGDTPSRQPASAITPPPVAQRQQGSAQPATLPPQQQQQRADSAGGGQAPARQQEEASAPAQSRQIPTTPQAPAADRGALDEQRKRVIQMAQRIVTAKAAFQQLRESMAQQGLRPRADLQGSAQRMQFEMDQAESALNGGNAAQAKQHLDYAERALEAMEKALNL